MTRISTHVLDVALGRPAVGIAVALTVPDGTRHHEVTDADGRTGTFSLEEPGTYRIHFDTAGYFAATGQRGFYPEVVLAFTVDAREHYHVPLLLSPYAYSTYRGS